MGFGGQHQAPGALPPRKRIDICIYKYIEQKASWGSGLVWTGEEILANNGIRSPDRPVRSE